VSESQQPHRPLPLIVFFYYDSPGGTMRGSQLLAATIACSNFVNTVRGRRRNEEGPAWVSGGRGAFICWVPRGRLGPCTPGLWRFKGSVHVIHRFSKPRDFQGFCEAAQPPSLVCSLANLERVDLRGRNVDCRPSCEIF